MRIRFICCVAFGALQWLLVGGCQAKDVVGTETKQPLAAAQAVSTKSATPGFAPLGSPKKLSAPKKATSAPLGSPNKPKFMLKNATPMARNVGGNAIDRAAELKRLVGAYEGIAIRYSDGLVLAKTSEEKEAIAKHAPSARALRSIARLMVHLIASNPQDEPALDGLVFLSKFVGVAEIDAVLAEAFKEGAKMDPVALLLEHHADNPKITSACRRLPRGEATDIFLHKLVEKTCNPKVRWAAGAQLFASHRRNNRTDAMEQLALLMSEDRYLEGVIAGHKLSARQWALNKVREIRTLGVGNVLPEVFGNKLGGGTGNITDYRGKVVVLDVWTTWCGPCRAMIPHHVELTERLQDKPFAILSVSCDRDQETLETFLEENNMPWDHWWVAPESEFKKALNIASFPSIFVLDAQGVIRHKNIKDEQLEVAVEALLAEVEASATESGN